MFAVKRNKNAQTNKTGMAGITIRFKKSPANEKVPLLDKSMGSVDRKTALPPCSASQKRFLRFASGANNGAIKSIPPTATWDRRNDASVSIPGNARDTIKADAIKAVGAS